MQNVAHAYRQTQAGTMGQGEVVVMLFDGALRFLAQAREKMQAKDFAAKGILISKTLDVLNELDGSLNMEAGGEISVNLHQLYFMCTSRLLQANLKLDVALLDSVVEILNGLRSAFAEILEKPEARAAASTISAKQAVKQQAVVSRPLQSHSGTIANPHHANSMYNMQNGLNVGMPGQAPSSGGLGGAKGEERMNAAQAQAYAVPSAQPSAAAMAKAQAALFQMQNVQTPAEPQASGAFAGGPITIQTVSPALSQDTAQPPASPRPAPTLPLAASLLANSGGFAGKKLAAYDKLIQQAK